MGRVHPRLAPDLYSAEHQRAQLDLEEHRRILEAYRQRDSAAARQAIAEHLERVKLDALAGLADLARVGRPDAAEARPGEGEQPWPL